MKIISKELEQCLKCSYYKGFVEEKYNGKVPVFCFCGLSSGEANKHNPVMIGYPDGRLFWKPCSDYFEKGGKGCHVPHFAMGSAIASPKPVVKDNKKLVCLVSTAGKSKEQIIKEAIEQLKKNGILK